MVRVKIALALVVAMSAMSMVATVAVAQDADSSGGTVLELTPPPTPDESDPPPANAAETQAVSKPEIQSESESKPVLDVSPEDASPQTFSKPKAEPESETKSVPPVSSGSQPVEQAASESEAIPKVGRIMSVGSCMAHKRSYAASASRKLYRALRSKGWRIKTVSLSGPLEIERRGKKLEFDVDSQESDKAYAFYASSWRETYVMVTTSYGPVVVAHRWPTRSELRKGNVVCDPVSSRIAFPTFDLGGVDVNPFKMWGLRVVWRLPNKLARKAIKRTPYDALTRAVKTMPR